MGGRILLVWQEPHSNLEMYYKHCHFCSPSHHRFCPLHVPSLPLQFSQGHLLRAQNWSCHSLASYLSMAPHRPWDELEIPHVASAWSFSCLLLSSLFSALSPWPLSFSQFSQFFQHILFASSELLPIAFILPGMLYLLNPNFPSCS